MSDECYTPREWLARARLVLGRIDLDPASCAAAQEVVGAGRFFTAEDNGLGREWAGRVWMNPPYSDPGAWCSKLLAEYQSGRVVEAVALLNARTGSEWFAQLGAAAWRCEKRKRIKFWGPGTKGGHGFSDSCFFYLGRNAERFVAVFGEVGTIVAPAASVTVGVTAGRRCAVCLRALDGMRSDASVCSVRCRKARQRAAAAGVERARRPGGVCGRCGGTDHHGVHCGACEAPVYGTPPGCVRCGQSFGPGAQLGDRVQLGK